jgi:hypothetical protein
MALSVRPGTPKNNYCGSTVTEKSYLKSKFEDVRPVTK